MKKILTTAIMLIMLQLAVFASSNTTVYPTISYKEYLAHINEVIIIADKDGQIIVEIDGVLYYLVME